MISSKAELKEYLLRDSLANYRKSIKAKIFGDECWKFILAMRKFDYYSNAKGRNPLLIPAFIHYKFKYHRLSVMLGFSVPYKNIGKGFSIAHYGLLTINGAAHIGENCRMHEGVCIGATNGEKEAARIGNNVFIGSGAKIIGNIEIADNVAIGAGAVVVKSITEPGTSWAGVPAKKVSDKDSKSNLAPELFV